ncbi:hypothetical protein LMG8520_1612 [Lactococcus lactis subsp. lactis]|uniref:Uncharacterized protein n=2 Tax=Lactococcus lactis TaxID=1358 RepID=A0A2A5SEV8_LACLH|nr:hypothetical protein LMG8520_1612 [Lactococcus lactis subsp. lactis]PCS12019.1 hypothetical protein RU90_GL000448 [Lactococcus lactis subsp. hordniae]
MGWTNPLIIIGALLGFILFGIFILTVKKVAQPLLDLGIFKSKIIFNEYYYGSL